MRPLLVVRQTYLPASGRLPWFAFFIRSVRSLRRRLLAIGHLPAVRAGPMTGSRTKNRRAPSPHLSLSGYKLESHRAPAYERSSARSTTSSVTTTMSLLTLLTEAMGTVWLSPSKRLRNPVESRKPVMAPLL